MSETPSHKLTATLDDHQRWFRIASQFSLLCMSNTKWRKVFTAIAESGILIRRCEFKCIDSEHITVKDRAPQTRELLETGFTDSIWQPFEYKWIGWFRFPREFKLYAGVGLTVSQDVESLQSAIMAAASACVELDENYLWLYGYRSWPHS